MLFHKQFVKLVDIQKISENITANGLCLPIVWDFCPVSVSPVNEV
jgi:hypothetical protein